MITIDQVWTKDISNRALKEDIAKKVAQHAKNGDLVGVGSGSTSFLTMLALAKRVKEEKIDIQVVPTSIEANLICLISGLKVIETIPPHIDWCFDGADEVDPHNRLIKGRGGAMLREKMVFQSSKKIFVVADESKSVQRLGEKFPVPIEVDPNCIMVTFDKLKQMPISTDVGIRQAVNKDGPVITEKGNVIIDVRFSEIKNEDELFIERLPGVFGTGIFSGFTFDRVS